MEKSLIVGFYLFLIATAAWAQNNDKIKVQKIEADLKPAPVYRLQTGELNVDYNRKWLIIEAELESQPEWVDEVTLKFYVAAFYGPAAKMAPKDGYDVLAASVTVVNVQRNAGTGKKKIVPVFLDANTVKKYEVTNLQNFIQDVAVQVWYNQTLVDEKWWKGNQVRPGRFWEQKQPRTGILLNLMQSPWYPAFSDYYEQVKSQGGSPQF